MKIRRTFMILLAFMLIFASFQGVIHAEAMGSITLKFVSNKGVKVSGIGIMLGEKLVGTTDKNGSVLISPISIGHHDIRLTSSDERIDGIIMGFYVRKVNDSNTVPVDLLIRSDSGLSNQPSQTENKTVAEKILLQEQKASSRNTKVTVSFDSTIPLKTQEYVSKLIKDIDPVIRKVVGAPIENGGFTLTYDPKQHVGYRDNTKTKLLISKLPNTGSDTDVVFDDLFTINYIHKYLQGRIIPVPGTRYNENLAHPIKTVVLNYINQEKIRKSNQKTIEYYTNAYDILESLGPNVLLNQGSTDNANTAFNPGDFLWQSESYEKMNVLTLEYAKSLWLKLYNERYKETGKCDFFAQLQSGMYDKNPKTSEDFYRLIDSIVISMNNSKGGDWLRNTGGFTGKITEPFTVKALMVKGSYSNILGMEDPNYIYPFIISRTPGKVISADAQVRLTDINGKEVYKKVIRTGFNFNGDPNGVEVPLSTLKQGKYIMEVKAWVDGKEITDMQTLYVSNKSTSSTGSYLLKMPDTKPIQRDTKTSIVYDSSIPQNARDYINKLIADIDPVIRGFAGAQMDNQTLRIKYNPNGLNGMNVDNTVLNTKKLPVLNGSNPDKNFDSFFFIEYFHMFHRGKWVPIEELRYSENISQAMKIVVGNYLNQNKIRATSIKNMEHYLNLFSLLDDLGPGVLVNNGINTGNPGNPNKLRNIWDGTSKYEQVMNTFTLDYSPTLFLKLADAKYKSDGQYDFFMKLQDALYTSKLSSEESFYKTIDEIVKCDIDGMKPSQWLKNTGLLKRMPEDETFVKVLPAKGSWFNLSGADNPDFIYSFVVKRNPYAKIIDDTVKISIQNINGTEVYSERIKPGISSNGDYLGMKVPKEKLGKGEYFAVVTANIDGKEVVSKKAFYITGDFK